MITFNYQGETSFKIRIQAKKLRSGKLQVRFSSQTVKNKDLYGYLLVESKATLKEVVHGIQDKLREMHNINDYYHNHLYKIGNPSKDPYNILIFDA